ncbi:MAG: response regulator [Gammaproteobacteria bacterium]|nr:response regulator [Gammaproteobacteria bacterium]
MSTPGDIPRDFKHVRFLIVDESAATRRLLESMLVESGAELIDQAAYAAEAIRMMERIVYDVVLCDYRLGTGRDGQQLLEEVRYKGILTAHTLFVMVTAENTAQVVMGVLECHPDDYLSLPVTRLRLAARLGRLLRRREEIGEIEEALEERRHERVLALCDERMAAGCTEALELFRLKADAFVALGRLPQAEAIYVQVFAHRKAVWAGLGIGRVCYMSEDYAGAVSAFKQTLAAHPRQLDAYDWLARTQVLLEDHEAAHQTLIAAIELSPRSIRRQMAFGELALRDGQYRLAARAFGAAVALGGRSIYRTASNYIMLARALMQFDTGGALRSLRDLRHDFKNDPEARLRAAVAEYMVYRLAGEESGAQASYEEALKIYGGIDRGISPEAMVELARMLLARGEHAAAIEQMRKAIGSRYEDEALLQEVRAVFRNAGMEREGEDLIGQVRDDVVRLNNDGVHLAEEGRLEEAAELFRKALRDLPENHTINMNTAKVLLLRMKRDGGDEKNLRQAHECIERLRRQDPINGAVRRLALLYREVAGAV